MGEFKEAKFLSLLHFLYFTLLNQILSLESHKKQQNSKDLYLFKILSNFIHLGQKKENVNNNVLPEQDFIHKVL